MFTAWSRTSVYRRRRQHGEFTVTTDIIRDQLPKRIYDATRNDKNGKGEAAVG